MALLRLHSNFHRHHLAGAGADEAHVADVVSQLLDSVTQSVAVLVQDLVVGGHAPGDEGVALDGLHADLVDHVAAGDRVQLQARLADGAELVLGLVLAGLEVAVYEDELALSWGGVVVVIRIFRDFKTFLNFL